MQKLLTFFQQKISMYLTYFKIEILASGLLTTLFGFEQLGPERYLVLFVFCMSGSILFAIQQFLDTATGRKMELLKF